MNTKHVIVNTRDTAQFWSAQRRGFVGVVGGVYTVYGNRGSAQRVLNRLVDRGYEGAVVELGAAKAAAWA